MSGAITTPTGTSDGVSWAQDLTHGFAMQVPALPHVNAITPPSYYTGPLPYYGDFQNPTNPSAAGTQIVIVFDRPIKKVRATAQFVGGSGYLMAAVNSLADFVGDTFTSVGLVTWNAGTSGTRTITHEAGFSVIVLRPSASGPEIGQSNFNTTIRNLFFFEDIVAPPDFQQIEQDVFLPRGAARTISMHWPNEFATTGDPPSVAVRIRPFPQSFGGGMISADLGSPPAGNATVTYRGKRAIRMVGGVDTGRFYVPAVGTGTPFMIFIPLLPPGRANLDGLNSIAVYQLEANLAFEQPSGPLANDCGIMFGPGANTGVRRPATKHAGVHFGLRDIDTLGLAVRQVTGAALTLDTLYTVDTLSTLVSTTFDIEDWHNYKLRLIGAQFGTDAMFKLLIDDVEIVTIPWSADTPLPGQHEGVLFGFYWGIINSGGQAAATTRMYLANNGFSLTAGPTEESLA